MWSLSQNPRLLYNSFKGVLFSLSSTVVDPSSVQSSNYVHVTVDGAQASLGTPGSRRRQDHAPKTCGRVDVWNQ